MSADILDNKNIAKIYLIRLDLPVVIDLARVANSTMIPIRLSRDVKIIDQIGKISLS
jgi:hypothetical protein